jgi:hypothetical protein
MEMRDYVVRLYISLAFLIKQHVFFVGIVLVGVQFAYLQIKDP